MMEASEILQAASSLLAEAPRPRTVGRPSTVARYSPLILQWLRDEPALSGAEVLRRLRIAGYRGGKSALYELVRRLRLTLGAGQA